MSAAHAVVPRPVRKWTLPKRMSRGRLTLPASALRTMAVPRSRVVPRQGPPQHLRSSLGVQPPPVYPGTAAGHLRPRGGAEQARPLGALAKAWLKATQLIWMVAEGVVPLLPYSVVSMSGLSAPRFPTTLGGSRTNVIRLQWWSWLRPARLMVISWPVETREALTTAAAPLETLLKSLAGRVGGPRGRVAQHVR